MKHITCLPGTIILMMAFLWLDGKAQTETDAKTAWQYYRQINEIPGSQTEGDSAKPLQASNFNVLYSSSSGQSAVQIGEYEQAQEKRWFPLQLQQQLLLDQGDSLYLHFTNVPEFNHLPMSPENAAHFLETRKDTVSGITNRNVYPLYFFKIKNQKDQPAVPGQAYLFAEIEKVEYYALPIYQVAYRICVVSGNTPEEAVSVHIVLTSGMKADSLFIFQTLREASQTPVSANASGIDTGAIAQLNEKIKARRLFAEENFQRCNNPMAIINHAAVMEKAIANIDQNTRLKHISDPFIHKVQQNIEAEKMLLEQYGELVSEFCRDYTIDQNLYLFFNTLKKPYPFIQLQAPSHIEVRHIKGNSGAIQNPEMLFTEIRKLAEDAALKLRFAQEEINMNLKTHVLGATTNLDSISHLSDSVYAIIQSAQKCRVNSSRGKGIGVDINQKEQQLLIKEGQKYKAEITRLDAMAALALKDTLHQESIEIELYRLQKSIELTKDSLIRRYNENTTIKEQKEMLTKSAKALEESAGLSELLFCDYSINSPLPDFIFKQADKYDLITKNDLGLQFDKQAIDSVSLSLFQLFGLIDSTQESNKKENASAEAAILARIDKVEGNFQTLSKTFDSEIKEIDTKINKLSLFEALEDTLAEKEAAFYKAYFPENRTKPLKKRIYTSATILVSALKEEKNTGNLDQQIASNQQLLKAYDRLLLLAMQEDTRDIEKLLKEAEEDLGGIKAAILGEE